MCISHTKTWNRVSVTRPVSPCFSHLCHGAHASAGTVSWWIKPSRPVDPTCCSSLGAPPVPIAPRCQQHCCLALKSSSHCPAECNTKQVFQDFGLPKLYPDPPLCTTSRVAIIRSSYINPVIFTLYRRVLLNQSIGAVKLVATQPSPLGLPAIWHPTQPPSRQSGRGWNSTTDVCCVLNGYG